MATCNFNVKNAKSYYAFADSYEMETEDGETYEVVRDEYDWEDLMDCIRARGEENKKFDCPNGGWNKRMEARNICETDANFDTFGNGNAWVTETNVEGSIVIRSGYYGGAVLDYDIKVSTNDDVFYLSEYDSVDDLVEDYLVCMEDVFNIRGSVHKWNVGTFKMQKKNIRKWIEKRIDEMVERCEKFCKENCETELCVIAIFSNGETIYAKVG